MLESQGFWHELAEHQGKIGDRYDHKQQRNRFRPARGEGKRQSGDLRFQVTDGRGAADGRSQRADYGNTDLHGRQETVRIVF